MSTPIRILIVDDHSMLRAGLGQLLRSQPDFDVVAEAVDGIEAVERAVELRPDVVLMDIEMPHRDGVEATRLIAAEAPGVRVVALTTFGETDKITAAIEAGAVGYLLKDTEPHELIAAVRTAAAGGAPLSPRAASALVERVRTGRVAPPTVAASALTNREREILSMVVAGAANKVIARRLGISEKTVKGHLTNVFTRLGVSDRTQAALWAERHGLTPG